MNISRMCRKEVVGEEQGLRRNGAAEERRSGKGMNCKDLYEGEISA
jgi:hypothetical protein